MPYDRISASGVQHGLLSDVDQANLQTARQNAIREQQVQEMQAQMQAQQDQGSFEAESRKQQQAGEMARLLLKGGMDAEAAKKQQLASIAAAQENARPGIMNAELGRKKSDETHLAKKAFLDYLDQTRGVNVTPGTAGSPLQGPPAPGAQPQMAYPDGAPDPNVERALGAWAGVPQAPTPAKTALPATPKPLDPTRDAINKELLYERQKKNGHLPQGQAVDSHEALKEQLMGYVGQSPSMLGNIGHLAMGALEMMPGDISDNNKHREALIKGDSFGAVHKAVLDARAKGQDPATVLGDAWKILSRKYGDNFQFPDWVTQ